MDATAFFIILDKIKEIASNFKPVDVNIGTFQINIGSNNNSNNTVDYSVDGDKKIITINSQKIKTEEEKKEVKEIITVLKNQKERFIEKRWIPVIADIRDSNRQHKEILRFYKDKIAPEDYKILKLSAYIKTNFDKHKPVDDLLKQLYSRYGNRGKNISHLYSSGYFKKENLGSVYETLEKKVNEPKKKFMELFDLIADKCPFAVFVGYAMTDHELEKEILKRKYYGSPGVNVHGIGSENIGKIRRVLAKIQAKYDFEIESKEENLIIVVTINFWPRAFQKK